MHGPLLLVSDEDLVAALIRSTLARQGAEVERVRTRGAALERLAAHHFDAVIIDTLPGQRDDLDLLGALEALDGGPPVLVLTAANDVTTRVRALELGADDSLAKPFEVAELSARVRALLRRGRATAEQGTPAQLHFATCEVDFETRAAQGRAGPVVLSEREAGLLRLLAMAAGRPVSRDEILKALWEPEARGSARTVDNLVLRLRKLFEADPRRPRHLLTVRGVGYRFVVTPDP